MATLGLSNFDSSFFSVLVEGIPGGTPASKYLTDKVISFEVTEAIGKMITGTIQFEEDYEFKTSESIKRFAQIEIQWGYKNKEQIQKDAYTKIKNSSELFTSSQLVRVGKGYVNNPSWNCGSDGKMVYNCSFMCYDNIWKQVDNKWFSADTKKSVVVKTLIDMGIISVEFVKFDQEKDIVSGNTSIRRDSISMFRFLHNLALEWQCLFRIDFDNKLKQPIALFCNYHDDKTIELFCNRIGSSLGSSILWEYKGGRRNVMSYTCQFSSAEGGSGDSVVAVPQGNGQIIFRRSIAKTEEVIYYRLNAGKMQVEMQQQGSIAAQTQLLSRWMKEKSFDELFKQGYFTKINSNTAPQGVGLTANIEAIGNPLCTAPARAKFGLGFPYPFSRMKSGAVFYQTSVTHKIDKSGYKMSVMCADAYTVSGGIGVA